MNRLSVNPIVIVLTVLCAHTPVFSQVSIFSTDDLQSAINDHSLTFDFILIDVRDSADLSGGVIASKYCRPYHFSWNTGDFKNLFHSIPTDFPVMVYDQTGALAMQAAKMLVDSGYTIVAAIAGGVNAYEGDLEDMTYLNVSGQLPQPSYFGDLSPVVHHGNNSHAIRPTGNTTQPSQQLFVTLLGRAVPHSAAGSYSHGIILFTERPCAGKRLAGFREFRNRSAAPPSQK